MLHSLSCQTTGRKFKCFGVTGTSLMEIMVFAPEMLPQTSVTMLTSDRYRQQWMYATQRNVSSFLIANQPTILLVPWRICVVEAATFLWMNTSHLQPRIWSRMSGRNWMMMLWSGAKMLEASWWRTQNSNSLSLSLNGELSGSSDTLKPSVTMLLIPLSILRKLMLLLRMELGNLSTITVRILLRWVHSPTWSIQEATQLQISLCENVMH